VTRLCGRVDEKRRGGNQEIRKFGKVGNFVPYCLSGDRFDFSDWENGMESRCGSGLGSD